MTPSSRFLALVIGGFILASGANVLWESRVVPNFEDLQPIFDFQGDGRLVTLTISTYEERFELPTALLDTAAGGVLYVPETGLIDEYTINTLARMTIQLEDYQSELSDAQARRLLESVRLEGNGRLVWPESDIMRFFIVAEADERNIKAMRLLFHDGSAFFVDEALLEGLNA